MSGGDDDVTLRQLVVGTRTLVRRRGGRQQLEDHRGGRGARGALRSCAGRAEVTNIALEWCADLGGQVLGAGKREGEERMLVFQAATAYRVLHEGVEEDEGAGRATGEPLGR